MAAVVPAEVPGQPGQGARLGGLREDHATVADAEWSRRQAHGGRRGHLRSAALTPCAPADAPREAVPATDELRDGRAARRPHRRGRVRGAGRRARAARGDRLRRGRLHGTCLSAGLPQPRTDQRGGAPRSVGGGRRRARESHAHAGARGDRGHPCAGSAPWHVAHRAGRASRARRDGLWGAADVAYRHGGWSRTGRLAQRGKRRRARPRPAAQGHACDLRTERCSRGCPGRLVAAPLQVLTGRPCRGGTGLPRGPRLRLTL
mmetsp:Transcript_6787/g.18746  ORF Transcript_6787/g.18746 Transcript_6787/m.18746 type:complete len:261 (+) Transcript_6787:150-932(+)